MSESQSSNVSQTSFLTPDFPTNSIFAALDPTPLDPQDPECMSFYDDIDSILVVGTSLELFQCQMLFVLDSRPQPILRCKNNKHLLFRETGELCAASPC